MNIQEKRNKFCKSLIIEQAFMHKKDIMKQEAKALRVHQEVAVKLGISQENKTNQKNILRMLLLLLQR